MRGYFQSFTYYKGVFLFILTLMVLEYFFGFVTESTNFVLKSAMIESEEHSTTETDFGFKRGTKRSIYANQVKFSHRTGDAVNFNITTSTLAGLSRNLSDFAILLDLSPSEFVLNSSRVGNSTELPMCPEYPPNLVGAIPVEKSLVPTFEQLEARFSWLKAGGHYAPQACRALKKVAIVVPYRSREEHLLLFLQHMHPFLEKQQLDYRIFIIEQEGNGLFNRALLMNVGYIEALKRENFDCFILHDIDLLPENDKNLYNCPIQPRHMSVAIDCFNYKLLYSKAFGGVSAISTEHFRLLNGFSNSFWGWGGEDDDMSNRVRHHKLFISRYPPTIARYVMLSHVKEKPSQERLDVLKLGLKKFDKDGLNNLNYSVIKSENFLLYTWILVKVDGPGNLTSSRARNE